MKPIHIAVTGGAGQLAYQFLFRVSSGELFGPNQPIHLTILEIEEALPALQGVKMELEDCAFPLLHSVVTSSDPYQAFQNADYAILIGSKPRGKGMERGDLLKENGKIFVEQGQALDQVAKKDVKVFVVGNPCNTNCLIAMHSAGTLSPQNFYAMTRLDQNRATFLLAQQSNVPIRDVACVTIWGNHSSTQVPDYFHARLAGRPTLEVIQDHFWLENDFMHQVQNRGAAIIQARGKSSAASAAQAVLDAIRDTLHPSKESEWFSSAIISDGNPYAIAENLVFSFPCQTLKNQAVAIVPALEMPEALMRRIRASEKELLEERDVVRSLLK